MNDRTKSLVAETRNLAKEQLAAAWQLHNDRIQEALGTQWPAEIEQIFEERLAALAACLDEQHRNALEVRLTEAATLEEQHRNAMETRVNQAATEARATGERELARKLNQTARCLRGSENGDWAKELVQATHGFCDRAAVFTLKGGALHLEAARGIVHGTQAEDVPLDAAPAFASAVESKDTVIAMRTRDELSSKIATWIGEAESWRSYIFPVATGERVLGLLYADADQRAVESSTLELLALLAAVAVDNHAAPEKPANLVNIAAPAAKAGPAAWSSLTREEQDLHARAQRFARVQVAEIRLYKSENVKKGRAAGNLYTSLKSEIDSARETYRTDFLQASGTMEDYLHVELVRTLANDDVELLGPDYPGPLV